MGFFYRVCDTQRLISIADKYDAFGLTSHTDEMDPRINFMLICFLISVNNFEWLEMNVDIFKRRLDEKNKYVNFTLFMNNLAGNLSTPAMYNDKETTSETSCGDLFDLISCAMGDFQLMLK